MGIGMSDFWGDAKYNFNLDNLHDFSVFLPYF